MRIVFAKELLPGIPDGGTVFELRTDISIYLKVISFTFCTGFYISFDKSKCVICFSCDDIYVGSPL